MPYFVYVEIIESTSARRWHHALLPAKEVYLPFGYMDMRRQMDGLA
jgi:hypothetical protein